jgi:hypothetical protein
MTAVTTMTQRIQPLALLAAAALALTACAGGPLTAPSSGASGGATEGATADHSGFVEATEDSPARNVPAPRAPEAVTEQSEAGARAALEHWWAAHRYLELTGDGSVLDEASGSGCGSCARTRVFWQEVYAEESWSTGSGRRPSGVRVEMSPLHADARFEFVVDQEDYDVWTSDAHVLNEVHRDFAELQQWGAKARYTQDGRWIVYDLWMYYDERPGAGEPGEKPSPEASEST